MFEGCSFFTVAYYSSRQRDHFLFICVSINQGTLRPLPLGHCDIFQPVTCFPNSFEGYLRKISCAGGLTFLPSNPGGQAHFSIMGAVL